MFVPELSQLQIDDWMSDSLLLDDLGYHDYGKIAQIDESGGWFVNRLKVDSNAPITDELRRWRGNAISLEGKQLQDVLPDLYRSEIDVTASFDTSSSDSELLPCEFRLADFVTTRQLTATMHLRLITTIACM